MRFSSTDNNTISHNSVSNETGETNGHSGLLREPAVRALLDMAFPALIIVPGSYTLLYNTTAAKSFRFKSTDLFQAAPEVLGKAWKKMRNYINKAASGKACKCRKFKYNADHYKLSFNSIYSTEGEFLAVAIVAHEISAQLKSDKALRESEERFRHLADFLPHAVWTANPDGKLDYCNAHWKQYTGNSAQQGPYDPAYLHPDDLEYASNTWQNALKSGEDYEIAYRFRDPQQPGEYRWYLGKAHPVKNSNNKVLKWLCSSIDIHDGKMLAEELERRVAERTRHLNEANTVLKRTNQELEQFAYVASHDLQEPLRKIKTFASRIREISQNSLEEASRTYLEKLMESAERMSVLISDVLNYSMVNQSEQEFVTVDLNTVVQNAVKDYELSIAKKEASIITSNLPQIEAIGFQMNQLFHNLLSNALKFSHEKRRPRIRISARKLSQSETELLGLNKNLRYQRITMRDNGIGFSDEYRDKIFVIFQRLHPRQKYSGTGIGLALCRKIAEIHKGLIYAESQDNKGTCFHIILPEEQHAKFSYFSTESFYYQASAQY